MMQAPPYNLEEEILLENEQMAKAQRTYEVHWKNNYDTVQNSHWVGK